MADETVRMGRLIQDLRDLSYEIDELTLRQRKGRYQCDMGRPGSPCSSHM